MRVLLPILRQLIRSPRRIVAVDDQRSWKAYQMYFGALHLARTIERSSDLPRIGVMLPTSGVFPMTMIATWLLSRTVVPLNYLLKGSDLKYVIDDAGLDLVITAGKMLEMFGPLPDSVKTLLLEEQSFSGIPPFRRAKRQPDDALAVLLYTSGTSGKPKGVMLTSANIAANVRQCIDWAKFTKNDVMLGVLPQFHSFGLTVLTALPLSVGCKVIYLARFLPKKMLGLLREHRPTAFIGIPSMYNALLHAKSATADDFGSLKYAVSGSEPLPDAVYTGFRDKFNCIINEGYGLTETAPVTNWCRPQEHKPRSVGPALPEVQEKIVDAEGNPVPDGEEGEVCIKGPNVMEGYFKLPEETAKVFDDAGYFKTGDIGKIDEDGHLFITGRLKEMLIIGGENVFPREIEEVINTHPSVHDCAVIGITDLSRGEIPLAFVELNEGEEFDETALRSHCRDALAGYKVPKEIRHIDKLPRNPTGKIMRRELKP